MRTETMSPGGREPNTDPSWPHGTRAQERIAFLARLMAGLCVAMMIGAALYLLLAGLVLWRFPGRVTSEASVALGVVGLLWIAARAFLVWGLWSGRRCFAALARGELFTHHTIGGLRNFAFGLFLYKAMSPLMFLVAAAASRVDDGFALPAGSGITGQDLGDGAFTLVSLGAIVVVTAVLARAAEIADDNASIV